MTARDWDAHTVKGTVRKTASIVCPTCGGAIILSDYAISDKGTVDRRVICPHCAGDVGEVELAGWDGSHKHGPFDIDLTG